MQRQPLSTLDQALASLRQQTRVLTDQSTVSILEASGRILAQTVHAGIDVPGFDNSAMDGYALNTQDLQGQQRLPVSQIIQAGHPGQNLQPGTAARIFTGAPVPPGANAVVIQEDTEVHENEVKILQVPSPGDNIRRRGHDIACGAAVLEHGHRLRPQDIGLLASLGIPEVRVYRPLRVAIINTGDELVTPGQALREGQIYDSNSYTLRILLSLLPVELIEVGMVKDDLKETRQVLQKVAEQTDCIISSGGVSVGEADFIKQALTELGELTLWKLAIKPGKPFSFGHLGTPPDTTPFFGLPGNPVAVFVTFLLLVKPVLLQMQGMKETRSEGLHIAAGFERHELGSRQEYLRVRLQQSGEGQSELIAFDNQGSSVMSSLCWADGLAVIPVNTAVNKGDLLEYLPFSGLL